MTGARVSEFFFHKESNYNFFGGGDVAGWRGDEAGWGMG